MSDKMPRGRNESVSLKEIFEVCQGINEPFGAKEASGFLPIGEERTRERLNELSDTGPLCRKKIGGANVYWIRGPHSINDRNFSEI
jgi:hypothetical protein